MGYEHFGKMKIWWAHLWTAHLQQLWAHALQWRHNERDNVSNHHPHDCLLKRLFRRRSTKASKLRVTGLRQGNSPVTGNFPHKGPVTQKHPRLMTSTCGIVSSKFVVKRVPGIRTAHPDLFVYSTMAWWRWNIISVACHFPLGVVFL